MQLSLKPAVVKMIFTDSPADSILFCKTWWEISQMFLTLKCLPAQNPVQDLLKLIERVVLKPQVASGFSKSKVFQEKERVPPASPVVD